MSKIAVTLVLLAAALIITVAGLAQTTSPPAGHWQGTVEISSHEPLGITVDLARNPKGAWIGSMSVPGTSSIDVPLTDLTVDGAAVRFNASLPELASFDGRLSANGGSLSGTASNDAGSAPFQLTRKGEPDVKVPPPSSRLSKEFEGMWEGTLDAGGKTRWVGLKLAPAPDGTAIATLIDQAYLKIPVTTVTINARQLQLESRAISGSYRGTLGANGEIAGEWSQGPTHSPLTFKHVPTVTKKP